MAKDKSSGGVNETRFGIRLSHQIIVTAPGLLNMMYLLQEMSDDMQVSEDDLHESVRLGAPHVIDDEGMVWVNGAHFKDWVESNRKPRRDRKLTNDEAFCPRCKHDVTLRDVSIKPMQNGKLLQIRGICTTCGITICRGGYNDQS
jgi:hypothetical protein